MSEAKSEFFPSFFSAWNNDGISFLQPKLNQRLSIRAVYHGDILPRNSKL
jgi:hypothetical protein